MRKKKLSYRVLWFCTRISDIFLKQTISHDFGKLRETDYVTSTARNKNSLKIGSQKCLSQIFPVKFTTSLYLQMAITDAQHDTQQTHRSFGDCQTAVKASNQIRRYVRFLRHLSPLVTRHTLDPKGQVLIDQEHLDVCLRYSVQRPQSLPSTERIVTFFCANDKNRISSSHSKI